MTDILRFEMNVPAEVVLKYGGPGKPIEGRYGNRVMYALADNRVMYVTPIVASRIADLGIQAGEVFQVCKQVKKQGQRRLIEWHVQRLETETQLEQDLRESIEVAQAAKAGQPSEAIDEPHPQPPRAQEQTATPRPVPTPGFVPASSGSGNGNGISATRNGSNPPSITTQPEHAPKTAPSTAPDSGTDIGCIPENSVPSVSPPTPAVVPLAKSSANGSSCLTQRNENTPPAVTTKLEHALKTAISAAYNAEKYGAELGYVVRFDADAIKSMAITVLINMSEGNRR